MDNFPAVVLGLDVSKAKVDCALLSAGKLRSKVIANSPAGFATLDAWLAKHAVGPLHACCEATGPYSEAIATHLADAGHVVSVVNPATVAAFARTQLVRAKTDRQDARLIAQFCAQHRPAPWQPLPPAQRRLLALVRDLHDLQTMRVTEANRLPDAYPDIQPRIQRHLDFLDAEIERVKTTLAEHIDHHDDLRGCSPTSATVSASPAPSRRPPSPASRRGCTSRARAFVLTPRSTSRATPICAALAHALEELPGCGLLVASAPPRELPASLVAHGRILARRVVSALTIARATIMEP